MDRNKQRKTVSLFFLGSLSARRAWIEISCRPDEPSGEESLSARRAWIEMLNPHHPAKLVKRRSPQGERG